MAVGRWYSRMCLPVLTHLKTEMLTYESAAPCESPKIRLDWVPDQIQAAPQMDKHALGAGRIGLISLPGLFPSMGTPQRAGSIFMNQSRRSLCLLLAFSGLALFGRITTTLAADED